MTVIAVALYKISLRDYMHEFHERVGLIYDVMKMVREGVEWVRKLLFQKPQE